MKLPMDKEWLEKRAALEGNSEIGAGATYVPPFIPSDADKFYSKVIGRTTGPLRTRAPRSKPCVPQCMRHAICSPNASTAVPHARRATMRASCWRRPCTVLLPSPSMPRRNT